MTYVSCGGSHTAAVTESGELWMWGCPDNGRLGIAGLSTITAVFEPTLVKAFVKKGIAIAKVCTWRHACECCVLCRLSA